MKVKNLNNTAGKDCNCGSWIKHWENFYGKPAPGLCAVDGCHGRDIVGGHVQKVDSDDRRTYIAPICRNCNNQRGAILDVLVGFAPLAPANVSQTCG